MKKGDLKKQEILTVAEELFCCKGYEQTSVQEILDRLNTSKGSFYHHFESKEALLEGICRERADANFAAASEKAIKATNPVSRLDYLLYGMIPFRDERLRFLLMLLPAFTLPEGRIVREYYCDALSVRFQEAVCNTIQSGAVSGDMFCTDPVNSSLLILSLVNRLWVQICDLIIDAESRHSEPDISECLRITDCCRLCIERYLSLPCGSISLIDIPTFRILMDQIHIHWPNSYTNSKMIKEAFK